MPQDSLGVTLGNGGRRLWDSESRHVLLTRHRAGIRRSDLARDYGVTPGRIAQLLNQSEREEKARQSQGSSAITVSDLSIFSLRIQMALIAGGYEKLEDVRNSYDSGQLASIENLGRRGLLEISSVLDPLGNVEPGQAYLLVKSGRRVRAVSTLPPCKGITECVVELSSGKDAGKRMTVALGMLARDSA